MEVWKSRKVLPSAGSFRNGGAYNAIHQSKNKLPRIAGAGIRAESRYGKSDRTFASRLGIHSLPAYLNIIFPLRVFVAQADYRLDVCIFVQTIPLLRLE